MGRTIILIPINNSIGLTTLSVSLMHLFKENKFNTMFFDPFYGFYHTYNSFDSTSSILKKYYFVPCINNMYQDNKNFLFHSVKEKYFIKHSLHTYYKYMKFYDIILIEGIKNNNVRFCIHDINLKLAKYLNAEIIFYTNDNLKNIKLIHLLSKHYMCLINNILGVIVNNISSHIVDIKISDMKYKIIKYVDKKQNINDINQDIKIIGQIPFNPYLCYIPINILFNTLQVRSMNNNYSTDVLCNTCIFYSDVIFNKNIKYDNTVLIISFSIFIKKYHKIIWNIVQYYNFHSILFTNVSFLDLDYMKDLLDILKIDIPIFYSFLQDTLIHCIIKKFYSNIIQKNNFIINDLIKYYLIYIDSKLLLCKFHIHNKHEMNEVSSIFFKKNILEKAQQNVKCILLPEGYDPRIIEAACVVNQLKVANCQVLGDNKKIYDIAKSKNLFITDHMIIDPNKICHNYIELLYSLRKHKGMTRELASLQVKDNLILGALMLYSGDVDGIVCGVNYSSADVLRAAFQIIGGMDTTIHENFLVSSIFFMLLHHKVVIYSDCAININPNSQQLCNIAIASADLSKLFNIIPRIAMLSYSTGFSGRGDSIDKVREATHLVKTYRPDLMIDGPIQYDAAVNLFISNIKNPHSVLKGQANVFIFPDLNSGNITYKAVQQTSNIISIGPILQGLNKPINDLSRGATVKDIIYTIAITSIQSN